MHDTRKTAASRFIAGCKNTEKEARRKGRGARPESWKVARGTVEHGSQTESGLSRVSRFFSSSFARLNSSTDFGRETRAYDNKCAASLLLRCPRAELSREYLSDYRTSHRDGQISRVVSFLVINATKSRRNFGSTRRRSEGCRVIAADN